MREVHPDVLMEHAGRALSRYGRRAGVRGRWRGPRRAPNADAVRQCPGSGRERRAPALSDALGTHCPWQDKKVIHARCETIDKRPTFKEAFAQRRGILVVKTFNEGKEVPSSKPGGKSKTEQYVIRPRDDKPVSIAVIFQRVSEPNGATLWEFAMVTTPNNKLIGTITDRMPAILQPADWTKWLGEESATAAELMAMLKPFEGDWDMGPEKPDPPRPTHPSKPPPPRKTDKPNQGRLFE